MANPLTIIEHACECGSTIKLHAGTVNDDHETQIYELWLTGHAGHERVENWEATLIRTSARDEIARRKATANA